MAPSRKKGATNKSKFANELRLGDLVLAKVKGFPAWPAKVSRPEDWERARDPKKYFVQFFGTQEIAFVAPADVQTFTSESKRNLLARCKGKTVKYFAQAVKEICEAFEELGTSDIFGHDDDAAVSGHDASNVGGVVNGSHVELNRILKSEDLCASDTVLDHTSMLGGCSSAENLVKRAAAAEEIKISGDFHEMLEGDVEIGEDLPIEASVASQPVPSSVKKETTFGDNKADRAAHMERIESSRASSSSPYSGLSEVKRGIGHHSDGKEDTPTSLGASGNLNLSAGRDKKSANGHKLLELMRGKRKIEGVFRHTDDAKSAESVKDRIPGKLSAGGYAKRLSSGVNKLETSPQGKVVHSLLKDQKLLDAGKNSPKDAIGTNKECGDGEYTRRKNRQISQDQLQLIKKPKHVHMKSDVVKGSIIKNSNWNLKIYGEEAVPAKRHRSQLEATSDVNVSSEDRKSLGLKTLKNNTPRKRRAVCLYNDDDDDDPKTPVHGGSLPTSKVGSSAKIPDHTRKTDENHENSSCAEENLRALGGDGGGSQKDCLPSDKLVGEPSMPSILQLKVGDSTKGQVSHSPGKEEIDKQLLKTDLVSPAKSPLATAAIKRLVDQQKPNRPSVKGSSLSSHIKAHNVPGKDLKPVSGGSNSSQSQVSSQKKWQPLSGERAKSIPKMPTRLNGPASSLDNQKDHDPVLGDGRLEDSKDRSGSMVETKAVDSATSMKLLIAAAQAKRRQANMQNVPQGNGTSVVAPTANRHGKSPSQLSTGLDSSSGAGNVTELDAQGIQLHGSFASPPFHSRQLTSHKLSDCEEAEDKRHGSGHLAAGSALSGGTEAAVARDAFEGMIETLSRTKESIGRATRLAIDCAKYGISNEVVELLIHKLENEPNFHKRVDLLFLVDSITQCSHSQKGVAGASYIPTVQAALPRLLGAAAPPGANARENRRQCLKVLRLWLERKILPESVLRRYMDDIGSSNDDASTGLSFRRPSRAERSVDDPIREMEGMLVDEYGSNATFNLPGFLCSHGFVDDDEDEEEDVPSKSFKESDTSPLQPPNDPAGLETGEDTSSDRRHHILEEVDGELEMEDVCGNLKKGALSRNSSKKNNQEMQCDTQFDCSPSDLVDSPSLEGSPPLPPESPPPLPPLPSSPPPPAPPPSSPSPPPPPSSPSPPPPPPPPPMLPSQPPPPGPSLQAVNIQPLLTPQPSVATQHFRPPSVVPPVQAPLPPDYSMPTGSHSVQIAGNTPQQVPCFPAGASVSHDTPGYSSVYAAQQAGQSNQQFQQNQQYQHCQATFVPRAFPPVTVPQPPSSHFSYNNPTIQQQMPQPRPLPPPPQSLPHPYTSASHAEGMRRFGDEQWRPVSADFKTDTQHNSWANGGRMSSCPSTNFIGEGYFRPPERALADSMGYQVSASNPAMSGPSTSGHVINQMLPSRPDMSSLNCWRPV